MSASRFVWFLIGVASGAAVGLVLTPGSGRENLRWAGDRGIEGAERLIGKERVDKGRRVVARGKEALPLSSAPRGRRAARWRIGRDPVARGPESRYAGRRTAVKGAHHEPR